MSRRNHGRHLLLILSLGLATDTHAQTFRGEDCSQFTTRDSVEFPRFWRGGDGLQWESPVRVSPAGTQFAFAIQRADLTRDIAYVDIYVGAFHANDRPHRVVTLATTNRNVLASTLFTNASYFNWSADSQVLLLLWSDGQEPRQVIAIEPNNGVKRTITHTSTDVVGFYEGPTGAIFYQTLSEYDQTHANELVEDGFVVHSTNLVNLVSGYVDGWDPWGNFETWILLSRNTGSRSVHLMHDNFGLSRVSFSSQGNYAILEGPPASFSSDWSEYDAILFDLYLPIGIRDPRESNQIRWLYLVDTRTGTRTRLWDAPSLAGRTEVSWSNDEKLVLLRKAFLPLAVATPTNGGLTGDAEVWVSRIGGDIVPGPSTRQHDHLVSAARSVIQVRENPNEPPKLIATDKGVERTVFDLADLLPCRTLGNVELVSGEIADGRTWSGRLYHPVRARAPSSPLVVQTHGYEKQTFSYLGNEGRPATYSAQALANEGFYVLQLGELDESYPEAQQTPEEARIAASIIDAAVRELSERYPIDPGRIGLLGYSWTGWHVLYAMAHSDIPYAAAYVADYNEMSYVQYIYDDFYGQSIENILGRPDGENIDVWIQNSGSFFARHVQAPIRIETDSGPLAQVIAQWDLYTRLRRLDKPVEFFVIPVIERGDHGIQIPSQQHASRSGFVDWMNFWLQGVETGTKDEQYANWRKIRATWCKNPARVRPVWYCT